MISIPKNISESEKEFLLGLKEFIRDDKQWVYDLFKLVDEKTKSEFLKLDVCSFNEDDESSRKFEPLYNAAALYIFWSILLRIYNSIGSDFLTYDTREMEKHFPKKKFKGIIELDFKATRLLVKKNVNQLIFEYLNFVALFLNFIKDDRSYSLNEYMNLFRDKTKLEIDLTKLLKFGKISSHIVAVNNKKGNPGAPPKYDSKEEFIKAFEKIPKKNRKSFRKIAKQLDISHNTAKKYLQLYSIDISKP